MDDIKIKLLKMKNFIGRNNHVDIKYLINKNNHVLYLDENRYLKYLPYQLTI